LRIVKERGGSETFPLQYDQRRRAPDFMILEIPARNVEIVAIGVGRYDALVGASGW